MMIIISAKSNICKSTFLIVMQSKLTKINNSIKNCLVKYRTLYYHKPDLQAPVQLANDVEIPRAINEWVLTDSCGGMSLPNTGQEFAPPISTISTGKYTLFPAGSTFFGNALTTNASFEANNVSLVEGKSFSIFYWLRFSRQLLPSTIYSIVSIRGGMAVLYKNDVMELTYRPSSSVIAARFNATVKIWFYIAIAYSATTKQLVINADGNEILTTTVPAAETIVTSPAVIFGGFITKDPNDFSEVSVYCLKLFNTSLGLPQFAAVAKGCKVGKLTVLRAPSGHVVFTRSSTYTVPPGVSLLNILVVGGGAGGACLNGASGGSGYVTFGSLTVYYGQKFNVLVGSGGRGSYVDSNYICYMYSNNGTSSFGGSLIAQGGNAPLFETLNNGGSGGSGGGSGTYLCSRCASGGGGGSGSAGVSGNSDYLSGSGQGPSFTASFSAFKFTKISAGAAAPGKSYSNLFTFGGGGAGGVLLNNSGPNAGAGACCTNGGTTYCGPINATGYGASGSSSCSNGNNTRSGNGANGLVYLEYF